MIYGELGRYSMDLRMRLRVIKYRTNLITGKQISLTKNRLSDLISFSSVSPNNFTWCTRVNIVSVLHYTCDDYLYRFLYQRCWCLENKGYIDPIKI